MDALLALYDSDATVSNAKEAYELSSAAGFSHFLSGNLADDVFDGSSAVSGFALRRLSSSASSASAAMFPTPAIALSTAVLVSLGAVSESAYQPDVHVF